MTLSIWILCFVILSAANVKNSAAECPICMDALLIADKSGSVGVFHFNTIVNFLMQFVLTNEDWTIGPGPTDDKFAVITYGTWSQVEWTWASHNNFDRLSLAFAMALLGTSQFQLSNLHDALEDATVLLNSDENREECDDVCIIILHRSPTTSYLDSFKEACDKLIVVGIDAKLSELEEMASDPNNIIQFDDFIDLLDSGIAPIAEAICS